MENNFKTYEATVKPPTPDDLRNNPKANVLFDLKSPIIRPYPLEYRDVWDNDHVKMPFSAKNLYPTKINGQSSFNISTAMM